MGESQKLRQQLESARREVEELEERCKRLEAERQELVTRNGNVTQVAGEDKSERKEDEDSDGRNSTPQPDYPTSPVTTGTLGTERDMAKGEEVVVQALTISLDTFRQRYQQHPPPPPTSTADGNWHLKESNGHYAKSRHSGKTHFQKSERKLPKTPDPGRRKELIWSSEQFEQMLGESSNLNQKEDETRPGQHYNTMETVSTRSFGFSRPSGSFVRRERERRLAQHRAQFVLQETSLGGQKMVHYRKSGNRSRTGEEKTSSLARSKSMDMVAMANRTDEGKRRVLRASSVSRVDDEERDWREQTPFLSPRRNGRRGDRTSWGLDEQGPIFEVANTAQRATHLQEAINPAMTGHQRRSSGKWKRTTSPPPPVPTPDYPDPPPISSPSSRLS